MQFSRSAVEAVFLETAEQPGRWEAIGFQGFSDHALFADPYIGVPAISLCHGPDRYNHSSADTLDKVSLTELSRSVAAAGVILLSVASGEDTRGSALTNHRLFNSVEGGVARRWAGPFNAREMMAQVSESSRNRARALIAQNKLNLALLFNIAIRIDGSAQRATILSEAMREVGLKSRLEAEMLFELLVESGWALDCGHA